MLVLALIFNKITKPEEAMTQTVVHALAWNKRVNFRHVATVLVLVQWLGILILLVSFISRMNQHTDDIKFRRWLSRWILPCFGCWFAVVFIMFKAQCFARITSLLSMCKIREIVHNCNFFAPSKFSLHSFCYSF